MKILVWLVPFVLLLASFTGLYYKGKILDRSTKEEEKIYSLWKFSLEFLTLTFVINSISLMVMIFVTKPETIFISFSFCASSYLALLITSCKQIIFPYMRICAKRKAERKKSLSNFVRKI